jgi:hypothetical protein
MSEQARSEQACPVCSQHTLALDRPPEIDVMGVQQYSDMLGMGDLHVESAIGIVCLTCGTHWRDKDAFDRGEPDPDEAGMAADADVDAADVDAADATGFDGDHGGG